MQKKQTKKVVDFTWIDRANLHTLKIKKWGIIGGCKLTRYVITTDGKLYFVRSL